MYLQRTNLKCGQYNIVCILWDARQYPAAFFTGEIDVLKVELL